MELKLILVIIVYMRKNVLIYFRYIEFHKFGMFLNEVFISPMSKVLSKFNGLAYTIVKRYS